MDEIHKIYPPSSPAQVKEVKSNISKLSVFKWNVVQVLDNVYFEAYLRDTWGNAFIGDNVVPARISYCSVLTDHFAILVNGDLVYCCKDFDGKTVA